MALNEDLIKVVQDIRRWLEDARVAIESFLRGLPPIFEILRGPIQDGLNEVMRLGQEFLNLAERILLAPGLETALREAAGRWHTEVAIPANALAGDLDLQELRVDGYLTGLAGHAYETTARNQAGFLTTIRITAEGIQSSLTSMASDVSNFIVAVSGAAAGAAVAVVGLVAAIAAPPSLPAALGVAAAGLALAVATIVPAVSQLNSVMNSAREQQVSLQQRLDTGIAASWPEQDTDLDNPRDWEFEETN